MSGTTGKLEYFSLLRLVKQGQGMDLDIHVHRYAAIAKGARLGFFSTIEMACREVDERVSAYRDTFWSGTPAAHGTSYVVDLVAGQTYERVSSAQRQKAAETEGMTRG
jgi:hypothetical protein